MSQSEVELAEELMRKARYPEAIERFRALLSVDPENAGVRARCGEAYRLSGNNERAFHHYNKAAAIFLRNADATGALRMLQLANAVSPNEPEVLFRMAECLKAMGEHQSMEPVLVQIISVAKGTGDRRKMWALDELAVRYPDDMDLCVRRAEALAEGGRIDDAVAAWKRVSAWLDQRGVDFVPMLNRAASIAPERADVGVDLANVLLANRRGREALALLVPYYEKFPDDVGVLDTLLRSLEALGATEKIVAARIEVIKARAKRGIRDGTMREISILLQSAPDDPAALEVCAHACTAFGENAQAISVWRKLAHLCDRLQRKFERDRAILMLLKANPDDEDALTLGARALREAARNEEAQVLENRLAMIRRLKARNAAPQKSKSASSIPAPPVAQQPPPSNPLKDRPRGASNPFGPEDGRHAKRRLGSGATVLAEDQDVLAQKTAPPARRGRFIEDPTVPPEEEHPALFSFSEPSNPSMEALPIARNPYVDDLYLETGPSGAQTTTGARSISTPSVSLDFPTKPYPQQTPPPDVWELDDESSGELQFEDSIHTIESDRSSEDAGTGTAYGALASIDDEASLPMETPGEPEETTSRIAELVSDELFELRSNFADETVRSSVLLENQPVARHHDASVPPTGEFDLESVRPTQRLPKLSELFAELERKKA